MPDVIASSGLPLRFMKKVVTTIPQIPSIPEASIEWTVSPGVTGGGIEAALRGEGGPYQALLALAVACEHGAGAADADGDRLRAAAVACGIAPEQASECHMQALSWAMQIQD